MSDVPQLPRAGSGSQECRGEILCSARQWDAVGPEWNELFNASPTASPCLRWEWLRQWWRVYGPVYGDEGEGLRIYIVRDAGGRLVGALPLYLNSKKGLPLSLRRLGFISSGESQFEETCGEYLDMLHRPGMEGVCVKLIGGMIANDSEGSWDELELPSLSSRSPLLQLGNYFPATNWVTVRESRGESYVADLSGGMEAYLMRLSPNTRSQARRLLRQTELAGLKLELASDLSSTNTYLDQLIALHQQRWTEKGSQGCFASLRLTEFHRSLVRCLVPRGQAVLARLMAGDRPLAVVLGYVAAGKFDYYLSGFEAADSVPIKSPGIAAHLLLKERLIERGITRYDYMAGRTRYKEQFSTQVEPLTALRIARPSVRTLFSSALNRAKNTARRVVRLRRQLPEWMTGGGPHMMLALNLTGMSIGELPQG